MRSLHVPIRMGSVSAPSDLNRAEAAQRARTWLFDHALPLWWTVGADRDDGGFFERIDLTGAALPMPKRVRVQARQTFAYTAAVRLGWPGPAHDAVEHGLRHIRDHYHRADGLYAIRPDLVDADRSSGVDLYDQAFVLLALASGWSALGKPAELLDEAEHLLAAMCRTLAHPTSGFHEAASPAAQLKSNPHMHLLEALLAWVQLGISGPFEKLARQIVDLACERMIYPSSGAMGEYFSQDWGRCETLSEVICEPGHQFEWAYLLRLATRLLSVDLSGPIARLEQFGAQHGVLDDRIIFSVDATGAKTDRSSRLWAQTEALRTYTVSPELAAENDAGWAARFEMVGRFLDAAPVPGLWRERTAEDGSWIAEPAPASSLYHVITGFAPLLAVDSDPLLALI